MRNMYRKCDEEWKRHEQTFVVSVLPGNSSLAVITASKWCADTTTRIGRVEIRPDQGHTGL